MCGLSGEIGHGSRRPDVDAVARMTDVLAPRGPDGHGVWAQGAVALGHRRLSIIDTSDRGAQPMVDTELGLTCVFNGCIYNHRELRERLESEGYRFFSDSDTEILLKGYHRWGDRFVERMAGMFAFCIVDRDRSRTLLGRDRLGIKPMYLAEVDGSLRFASTLPALLAGGGVDTSLDPVGLHHYLTFHSIVPAPHTILAGARKLPPATLLAIEADGSRREERYWQPAYGPVSEADPRADWDERDWQDAVAEALRVAVERRLVSDVPVGVLLSGGLDSSLIVAMLAECGHDATETFSIGFDDCGGQSGDEFRWSDMVAREFGTEHHRLHVPAGRLLPALGDAVRAMGEPMASHDTVAFWLLSQEVGRHVKVVQSGQGADEVFAGYHWFQGLAAASPDAAADAYLAAFRDRPHAALADLLEPDHLIGHDVSGELVRRHMAAPGASTAVDRALRFEVEVMMVDDPVKRVDAMTMDAAVEARVPFLDHDLVELAAACPAALKLADDGKGILKEIGRKRLPAEVIDRPKGYFPVPGLTHLDAPAAALLGEVLNDPAARARGVVRPGVVDRLLADPNGHRTPTGGNVLWHVALLEWWLQEHVDR